MSTETSPHIPDLNPTIGALYIGVITGIGLFGITTLQTWLYYSRYPSDIKGLRIIVAVVWCLELLHSVLGAYALYYYLVFNWGNISALDVSFWSLNLTLLVTGLVELIVRMFFMWRVWIITDYKWYLPAIIGFFTLISFAFDTATYALSTVYKTFSGFKHPILITSHIGLGFAIASDVTISASLAYFLNSRRTGFSKTSRLINRLIFIAINIGLLTSLTDIVVSVLSQKHSGAINLAYLAVYEVVSKLYANSLLATLNVRAVDDKDFRNNSDFRMSEIRSRQTRASPGASKTVLPAGSIVTGKAPSTSDSIAEQVVDVSANGIDKSYAYGADSMSFNDRSLGAV